MRHLVYLALLLCTPTFVSAQVLITEIMYAPEGADADREWIEVCNSGGSSINLSNWKFFENDTNHGLNLVSGTETLSPSSCAVIADDSTGFLGDYGGFSETLFDSAFSLKNTGETLVLKDDTGEEIDRVTYSDADGAKDDGLSLHRDGAGWSPGTPTPGLGSDVGNAGSGQGESSGNSQNTTNTTLYSYKSVTIEPPQDVFIRIPTELVAFVYSYTKFRIESHDATGGAVEGGKVTWAFGDGGEAHGREVSHQFLLPGEYIVTVSLEHGSLFDVQQIRVVVVPLSASLHVAEDGSWVAIENESEHQLDVSNWRITSSGQYFRIPDMTIVPALGEARFATEITKLTTLKALQQATLVYPDGKVALPGTIKQEEIGEVEVNTTTDTPVEHVQKEESAPKAPAYSPGVNVAEAASEEILEVREEQTDAAAATQTATVILGSKSSEEDGSAPYWYFGLAALLTFAVSVAWLGQPRKLIVDGFEVIESKE